MKKVNSVLSHFSSKIAGSVAGFATTLVIARILGANVFGVYVLAQSIIVWTVVPAWGVSKATEKFVSEQEGEGAYFSSGIILSGLTVAVTGGVLLAFSDYISEYVGADVTLLIVFVIVTTVAFDTVGAILKGENQVSAFGWLTSLRKVLQAVFQIAFIILGSAVVGLLVGHAIALIVVILGGVWFLRTKPTIPSFQDLRRTVEFARFSWIGGFKSKTFGWMDTLMLGIFVSSSLVGIYQVAWTLSAFLVLASDSIREVMFPQISRLDGDDDYRDITDALEQIIQYTGIIVIPGFFGSLIIGPRLLKIYSPEFMAGSAVLSVLILAQMFEVYGSQFVDVLYAVNRPDAAFRVHAAFIIANICLNLILISILGWVGAAIATLVSSILTLSLGYYYLLDVLETVRIPVGELARQIVSAMLMAGIILPINALLGPGHLITILIVFVGASIYALNLLLVSTMFRENMYSFFARVMRLI